MSTQPREPYPRVTALQEHQHVPSQASAAAGDKTPDYINIPWQKTPVNLQGSYGQPGDAYTQMPPARPAVTRVLGYHRLSHADPKTRWWSPLVEGLIGIGVFAGLSLIITLPLLAAIFVDPYYADVLTASDPMQSLTDSAFENPWMFAYLFGSVAIMFPSLWVARLCLGPRPWGLVHSVSGRMRWGWLLLCIGLAVVVFVGLPMLVGLFTGESQTVTLHEPPQKLWIFIVLLLTLVPVQCYAEELVFRGYLMQTIGRWLKHPAFAILLPAPLFMLGHTYDLWGQASVLCMGIAAGFLAWRTGGLESGIALHVVNNVIAMFGGLMGTADPFVQEGSVFTDFALIFAIELIYVLAVLWAAKRRKLQRTREETY
ncbi:CPBP family intramembrane glutamic endopeptidase [Rothia terrae]|uniref:CPBP family intramembrane glutamic endopeptidase n=1 Tax=Rothia terrae TaxID=396015 RepID=UPI002881A754|nr:CPBP family intramembrane glutamic endopeptidase [Rothia terrae]MDT0189594.1 CPBP family intramembrane metalloprotease [Rothia terrae]